MSLRIFFQQVKRHWLTIAFVGGFTTDFLLLNRVDDVFDNAMLLFYVVLATISVLLMYASIAGRLGETWSSRFRLVAPLFMQYSFGGLFSGMLIFYGHSGDMWASWPYLLLIIGAIAGNELIHNRGQQLVFNILAYFIGLFSYLVLVIPVFTGLMGPWIFFGSGSLALVLVYGLIRLLALIIPNYLLLQMRPVVFLIVGMFVFLNTLYFTNVIPPIPLSLQDIVIAHSVVRFASAGSYELTVESVPWWRLYDRLFTTFHPGDTGAAACFTRVYAPTRIKTEIFHHWEYQDERGRWQDHFTLSYPITGESVQGYRGYTYIQSPRDGVWRCSVETARGQVLGRREFTVDSSRPPVSLIKRVE
jgi:hypothetical protein